MYCGECGKSIPNGVRFCGICGALAGRGIKFCAGCAMARTVGKPFCRGCGKRFEGQTPVTPVVQPTLVKPVIEEAVLVKGTEEPDKKQRGRIKGRRCTAQVGEKGKTTFPKPVRDFLKVEAGKSICFIIQEDRVVLIPLDE